MYPEGGGGTSGSLLDELVEGEMGAHPFEPLASCLGGWYADVDGFACQMLGVGGSPYGPVEGGGTVAAADDDGTARVGAEGLEDGVADAGEVGDDDEVAADKGGEGVVDVEDIRRGGTDELDELEMG